VDPAVSPKDVTLGRDVAKGSGDDGPVGAAAAHTLFSIALRMPERTSVGFFGHEVAYQRTLTQAAERHGSRAAVVVPGRTDADIPGMVSLELDADPGGWVGGLRKLLEDHADHETTVLAYEGNQESLASILWIASLHPYVVFIVNLFGWDRELSFPHLSERSVARGLHLEPTTSPAVQAEIGAAPGQGLPRNVVVYADTARRAQLAHSLGLQNVKVWPLYSVLEPFDDLPSVDDRGTIRVVVPLAGRQVTRQIAYEIATVAQLCQRYAAAGQRFDWYVFGGGYDGHWRRRARAHLMQRLRAFGVRFEPNGLSTDQYARVLADADVVWFPKRGFYTTQSSGKAADALVSGTPVLAPNGSYPAQEQERWAPGAPAYTGAREAVEILLRSRTVWPTIRSQLAQQLEQVRWWYSPERAVEEILTTAAQVRANLVTSDQAATVTSDGPQPPPPKPTPVPQTGLRAKAERVARTRFAHLQASATEARVRASTLLRIR